jgi:hypothetical protein
MSKINKEIFLTPISHDEMIRKVPSLCYTAKSFKFSIVYDEKVHQTDQIKIMETIKRKIIEEEASLSTLDALIYT